MKERKEKENKKDKKRERERERERESEKGSENKKTRNKQWGDIQKRGKTCFRGKMGSCPSKTQKKQRRMVQVQVRRALRATSPDP